jgi:hypothetical protein
LISRLQPPANRPGEVVHAVEPPDAVGVGAVEGRERGSPRRRGEGNEAEEASSEHFPGVDRDAPWMSRALVIGGLAVVGVGIYATQQR